MTARTIEHRCVFCQAKVVYENTHLTVRMAMIRSREQGWSFGAEQKLSDARCPEHRGSGNRPPAPDVSDEFKLRQAENDRIYAEWKQKREAEEAELMRLVAEQHRRDQTAAQARAAARRGEYPVGLRQHGKGR